MIENNIYNISNLDDYIKSLNLKILSNTELNYLIYLKISKNDSMIHRFKLLFNNLIMISPIKTKKAIFVLTNMRDDKKLTAYCYRHLVKTAYQYNVPYCIINNYTAKKYEYYNILSDMNLSDTKTYSKIKRKVKNELFDSTILLLESTIEIVKSKNTRKEKIMNLLSK